MARTTNIGLELAESGVTILKLVSLLNENLQKIDTHNHAAGKGVSVPISALQGDSDLILNAHNILRALALGLENSSQDSLLNASLYFKNGDLYCRDAAGRVIQLTSSGQVAETTTVVDQTTSLLYGLGEVKSSLDITENTAVTEAVTAFQNALLRTSKTADTVKTGSYVEYSSPAPSGYYRPFVAFLVSDLQANTKFYNSENFDEDSEWIEAQSSIAIGAASYTLFTRKTPLSQDEIYGLVVRSWR